MAEWIYEEGIGENRAALVEGGEILEAQVEVEGQLNAGTIAAGRLTHILVPGRRGIVALKDGGEALVEPLPPKFTEGAAVLIEITREPIPEKGRPKLAKGRISEGPQRSGPTLLQRLTEAGSVTRLSHFGPDRLEAAGWTELIEEAVSGDIPFPGGALRMSLTPAMTLFDVDGSQSPAELAVAGAAAAARAIRRFGITGSIGIDLPTVPAREARQAAAQALDAILPQPFERTAVNGFGFLQVIRKRERLSIPEHLLSDPVGSAVRLLLRKAERSSGTGERLIRAAPSVIQRLHAEPSRIAELSGRIGAPVLLEADASLGLWSGHAQARNA